MSDRGYLTTTSSTAGFATRFRDNTEGNFGLARMQTVVHYTSGPQTLAEDADLALCDVTSAGFSVLLPASPADGDYYEIQKIDASGNTLTLDRNGKTIRGAASNLTTTTQWAGWRITWSSSANTWVSRAVS